MKKIDFNDGSVYYWQKTLAAFIEERQLRPMALIPRVIEVNDEPRLVLDLKDEYTAKGQKFVETQSFWSNRVLIGDEIEALQGLGTLDPKQCILHYGIFFPKETDPAIFDALKECLVPDDFGKTVASLTEAQAQVVVAAVAKTDGWKIDTLSDGVKTVHPDGDRATFVPKA